MKTKPVKNDVHNYLNAKHPDISLQLDGLIVFINANPEELNAFSAQCWNLLRIREVITEKRWPEVKTLDEFAPLLEVIVNMPRRYAINDTQIVLPERLWIDPFTTRRRKSIDEGEEGNVGEPYQGFQLRFPVGTMMHHAFDENHKKEYRDRIWLMLAHILFAAKNWRDRQSDPTTIFPKNFYMPESYRRFREIIENDENDAYELPKLTLSPARLLEDWQAAQAKDEDGCPANPALYTQMQAANATSFGTIMRKILLLRGVIAPGTRYSFIGSTDRLGDQERNFSRGCLVDMGIPEPPDFLGERGRKKEGRGIWRKGLQKKDFRRANKQDRYPGEGQLERDAFTTPTEKGERSGGNIARHQQKKLAMSAQNLWTSNQFLQIPEITLVLAQTMKMFEEGVRRLSDEIAEKADTLANLQEDELYLAICKYFKPVQFAVSVLVQVFLGRSRVDAQYIDVADIDKSTNSLHLQLVDQDGVNYWRYEVLRPKGNPEIKALDDDQRPVSKYLMIPDFLDVGSCYKTLERLSEAAKLPSAFTGFKDSDYLDQLKLLTGGIREKYRKRVVISDAALTSFLPNQMIRDGVDPVDTVMICRRRRENTDVQLYYACSEAQRLVNLTYKTLCRIVRTVSRQWPGGEKAFNLDDFRVPQVSGWVGANQCPTMPAIQKLVRYIREAYLRAEAIEDIHNWFVVHTVFFVSYETSYRAVSDPMIKEEWFDKELGVAAISDKDGLASEPDPEKIRHFFNTRIVPLTKGLCTQMDRWRLHHRNLLDSGILDLDALSEKKRDLVMSGGLFYLEDGKPVKCKPSRTEKFVSEIYGFKMNSGRRFLRTELIHRGVFYQLVDAFMSHAAMGQEMSGKYSSLDPQTYLPVIRGQIEEISAECGWRPLKVKIRRKKGGGK